MNETLEALSQALQTAIDHGKKDVQAFLEREYREFEQLLETLTLSEKRLLLYIRNTPGNTLSRHLKLARANFRHFLKYPLVSPEFAESAQKEDTAGESTVPSESLLNFRETLQIFLSLTDLLEEMDHDSPAEKSS